TGPLKLGNLLETGTEHDTGSTFVCLMQGAKSCGIKVDRKIRLISAVACGRIFITKERKAAVFLFAAVNKILCLNFFLLPNR
ncbi:MAG: hypothetical protein ACI4SB_04705, partial [Acutalibacteraceae bacterium]